MKNAKSLFTDFSSVFIGMAEGDTMQDPEVQKSALSVIINCVCGPLERVSSFSRKFDYVAVCFCLLLFYQEQKFA